MLQANGQPDEPVSPIQVRLNVFLSQDQLNLVIAGIASVLLR
jgi:hypothetical protein